MLNPKVLIYDVFAERTHEIGEFPFRIGAAPSSDLILDMVPGALPEHATLAAPDGPLSLSLNLAGPAILDGQAVNGGSHALEQMHAAVVAGCPFFVFKGADGQKLRGQMDFANWYVYRADSGLKFGPGSPEAIHQCILDWPAEVLDQAVIFPSGSAIGFPAPQFLVASSLRYGGGGSTPNGHANGAPAHPDEPVFRRTGGSGALTEAVQDMGDFLCPVCWLHFDQGDVMHIAVHGSLRGDAVLGEEYMQRFHASRFNDRGQALDAKGLPTSDLACPHCRRKLPPGFFDSPHHIFSIVGAPSSGKSYYLSVLIRQLQVCLFKRFDLVFRDADPSGNALLNQMKAKLFSSSTPQEAALIKTQLEGEMYETLPRMGRKVALPKPFIFQVAKSSHDGERFSLVFYDNAGEHFEPNRNSIDSPGAQHIASAQAIFFLFDPLHNNSFRKLLDESIDPQLENSEVRRLGGDQQDVILTESDVRIKQLLGMDNRARLSTPLAFMVGKYDAWAHLHGVEDFFDPIGDGHLKTHAIDDNSKQMRDFLLKIDPAVVANAEAISSNVRYFPISPLGHPPVKFTDENGEVKIGPDPAKLAPFFVEIPVLWALSQLEPGFVPSR